MKIPQGGLRIDSPSFPLLQAGISYWGVTSGNGNALGTTVVCADLANHPSFVGLPVKIMSGGAAGQVRLITIEAAGTVTVDSAFTDSAGAVEQIVAGTSFVILSALSGGGGSPPTPSVGLWMFGVCDPGMAGSTTTIVCPNLAGFPNDIFNEEFWMQVIHNNDAPGTAPEREWRRITDYVGATGTFTTDAFSANVEADDLVAIAHESIVGIEIIGYGTLDTSSVTVPADSTRAAAYAWENNDYFKGCMLIPTEGDCRFQPRPIRSYVSATGVFTLDEQFSQLPGLVDYVIVRSDYPVQRLIDIFNLVNAILFTTETGGTLTTDGTEQNVYINNAPSGVFWPRCVKIDFTNQTATEVVVLRLYYRIKSGGNLILQDTVTYNGAITPPLISIDMEPNRYGVKVTIEKTAGVNRDYDWEALYDI